MNIKIHTMKGKMEKEIGNQQRVLMQLRKIQILSRVLMQLRKMKILSNCNLKSESTKLKTINETRGLCK